MPPRLRQSAALSPTPVVAPVLSYPHPGNCVGPSFCGDGIIGGYVMHDPTLPSLNGCYVFGDLSNPGSAGRWSRRAFGGRPGRARAAGLDSVFVRRRCERPPVRRRHRLRHRLSPRLRRQRRHRPDLPDGDPRQAPTRQHLATENRRAAHPRRQADVHPRHLDRREFVRLRVAARRRRPRSGCDVPADRRRSGSRALLRRHGEQCRRERAGDKRGRANRQGRAALVVRASDLAHGLHPRSFRAERHAIGPTRGNRLVPPRRASDRHVHRGASLHWQQDQGPLPARRASTPRRPVVHRLANGQGKLPSGRQARAQPPALQRPDRASRTGSRPLPAESACPRQRKSGVRARTRSVLDQPLRITEHRR